MSAEHPRLPLRESWSDHLHQIPLSHQHIFISLDYIAHAFGFTIRQHFTRRKLPLSRGGIWTCLSCPCRDTKKKKKMGNGKECEVEAHPPISQKGIQSLGGLFFGGPCRPLYLYNLGPCWGSLKLPLDTHTLSHTLKQLSMMYSFMSSIYSSFVLPVSHPFTLSSSPPVLPSQEIVNLQSDRGTRLAPTFPMCPFFCCLSFSTRQPLTSRVVEVNNLITVRLPASVSLWSCHTVLCVCYWKCLEVLPVLL